MKGQGWTPAEWLMVVFMAICLMVLLYVLVLNMGLSVGCYGCPRPQPKALPVVADYYPAMTRAEWVYSPINNEVRP